MAKIWVDRSDDDIVFGADHAAEPELIEPMPVPVLPQPRRSRYTDQAVRPSSNFVAQLMAVDRGYPQTRAVDRAEPGQATAAYRTANAYAASGRTRRFS
ncbi:hypothetical protein SR870_17810 [Rhodopseudomonas palustris]|uniref:hypothetical protein n=1 Tax=Rhodopseudomonas palustris TaxID=1076 RepID=UPI002ACDE3A5|nr:hypothetical protein [Rhodopseudomonas palustris]WQG98538.1 hypothetical protein SR870_17810 [Rhodopseudomonas palustris]